MNRVERRRRVKEDEKLLTPGIDPHSTRTESTAAMARQLHALFERARRDNNVDPPIKLLHAKATATLDGLKYIPLACKKGCAHCCHIWVSATAPEVLFVAKLLRRRGDRAAIDRVRSAHLATKDYDYDARLSHPHPCPCPMLQDGACSIYESRPRACRFAVSGDAAICARSVQMLTNEEIPVPVLHLLGQSAYAIALTIALRHAGLPYHAYEFNAALARALERDDAERAWLAGDDIFSDVVRDPTDLFANGRAGLMYEHAFR